MVLPDVNVLIYAFNPHANRHADYRAWLTGVVDSPSAFALAELVLASFVRIVTNPRIFDQPEPVESALDFCQQLRSQPNAVLIGPGERHWSIFANLCRTGGVRGGLVQDAYIAALAIEHGCDLVTTDRDFARFADLKWRHPLE